VERQWPVLTCAAVRAMAFLASSILDRLGQGCDLFRLMREEVVMSTLLGFLKLPGCPKFQVSQGGDWRQCRLLGCFPDGCVCPLKFRVSWRALSTKGTPQSGSGWGSGYWKKTVPIWCCKETSFP
jgi:hypothetical protein